MSSSDRMPPTDLTSLHAYLSRDFAKERRVECASCAKLRAELKSILTTLVSYVKTSGYGVEEMIEDHRAAATYDLGLPPLGVEASTHSYYAKAGKQSYVMSREGDSHDDLSPALRELMMGKK